MSSQPIMTGHQDYLEATALQQSAIIEGAERQDGRTVSPLTWKDGEYQFSITWPSAADDEAADADAADEADPQDQAYQAVLAKAQRLDLADLVAQVGEQLAGKAEDSPLYHLAEAWAANPLPDWERPTLSPWQAEAIGKWLAIQLARLMGQALAGED
jgi:hypothetical protein